MVKRAQTVSEDPHRREQKLYIVVPIFPSQSIRSHMLVIQSPPTIRIKKLRLYFREEIGTHLLTPLRLITTAVTSTGLLENVNLIK
jgi:hypothetical protein